MALEEVVKWLLDNGYGIMVYNDFVITKKLNDDLKGGVQTDIDFESLPATTTVKYTIDKKEIWNKFIRDAEIPHRVNTPTGSYTVRQYNLPAVKKLISILSDPTVNYDRLVASTKHYYKTVTYKIILSRYLINDVWKDEYDHYKESSNEARIDGSSRWED